MQTHKTAAPQAHEETNEERILSLLQRIVAATERTARASEKTASNTFWIALPIMLGIVGSVAMFVLFMLSR